MTGYLERLTVRLANGAAELPEETRRRHARFVLERQQPDGGFPGREGGSDLYYTGFALRSLSILGELYGEPAERAAAFLRSRAQGRETILDLLSLIYGAALIDVSAGIDVFADSPAGWRAAVGATLERLRREDGGYAKALEGSASSTYHSFLVLLCHQLLEVETPRPEELLRFIRSQEAPDGGFLEIRAGKRAGTNPTAAAIGVLRALDALDEPTRERTADFLADMQTDEGGLRANTRIPVADLLSTFTGLWTLQELDESSLLDLPHLLRFVRRLECDTGGFLAAEIDESCDLEYTFYGIAAWSLLV